MIIQPAVSEVLRSNGYFEGRLTSESSPLLGKSRMKIIEGLLILAKVKERAQDKLDLERATDLEDLARDNYLNR